MLCASRSIYVAVLRKNTELSLVWFATDIYAQLLSAVSFLKRKIFSELNVYLISLCKETNIIKELQQDMPESK